MSSEMVITLPLSVPLSARKKFILNMNRYRNAHWRDLAKAKKGYLDLVLGAVHDAKLTPVNQPVALTFKYFHGRRERLDITNPCSIIDKFACDALVTLGILPEDDYTVITDSNYTWGGIDRKNPRCELYIKPLEVV